MINTERMSVEDLKRISVDFEASTPQEVLRWALAEFHPDLALACSFGAEDVALIDMIVKIEPDTRIFYLDTEVLFAETYTVRDQLIARYGIQPIAYKAALAMDEQSTQYGKELYWREPDRCCFIRKVEPLQRALKDLQAWITGIRREQSPTRANAGLVEWDTKFNLVKLNPLARWTTQQVWDYIKANNVPYNVLHDHNYPSIGCVPCTKPVNPGDDPRSGRWAGFVKTECGLHQE
jgi:phosphoadenosine phosphosulfate reductase